MDDLIQMYANILKKIHLNQKGTMLQNVDRYCSKFWTRGVIDKLEVHLALKREEISQIYLKELAIE